MDCFGVNWDIEDSDFPAMFADAMQQAQPTLDNPALQPIGGLQNLMLRDSEVELVRECFRWLYNEDGGDISKRRGRAELFADQINGRFRRVFPRMSKYTMNTANAVFFLNLWEPHANYFYQPRGEGVGGLLGYGGRLGGGTALDLPRYYTMCNDLLHALENYPEIIALHKPTRSRSWAASTTRCTCLCTTSCTRPTPSSLPEGLHPRLDEQGTRKGCEGEGGPCRALHPHRRV